MESFQIRTAPLRLPWWEQAVGLAVVVVASWVGWRTLEALVLAARVIPSDPSRYAICAALLALLVLVTAVVVHIAGPMAQVLARYHFRDRGRTVVAFSLEREGWRWRLAGTNVLMPWEQLSISIVDRSDECYRIRLRPGRVIRQGRDPLSRRTARELRRRGWEGPMTLTDPTEDELAAVIRRLSGDRVRLT